MKIIHVLIIILALVVFLVVGVYISRMAEKTYQDAYDYYNEWCPKLGAEVVERNPRYAYYGECFKIIDNEAKFYDIGEINGQKYLRLK